MVGCSSIVVRKWLHKYEIPPKDKYRGARNQGPLNLEKYRKEHGSWNKGLTIEDDRVKTAIVNSARTRRLRGSNLGEKHARWIGDKISYKALHTWVNRHKGKAEKCIFCGSTKRVEWANKSKEYKRDLSDFIELCRSCHGKYDLTDSCKYGHKYTIRNTHIRVDGSRQCRQCNRNQYYKRKEVKI